MTGTGSPCGACKFLRRKCVRGCVFAPYFCHEQGATHFAAIHKVFGASNVSKLLAHLPVSDRCEAAVTISYEAQARLQDPIYGCVSHIFALQQQVFNLQAQLASLKEQAASQTFPSGSAGSTENPNYDKTSYGKFPSNYPQDVHSWFQSENSNMSMPQFDNLNISANVGYSANGVMNMNSSSGNYEINSVHIRDESVSFSSFEEASNYSMDSLHNMQTSNRQYWTTFRDDMDDLQSVAFGYIQH